MNLDGETYTVEETENKTGTTGQSVTPDVKSYTGFTSPATKTVTISASGNTEVEYLYEIRAMAGEYKELFQFPLVKVGFLEDNIHDKSLAARKISERISKKGYQYPIIGDVPMYDKIRASLSCGRKKWWSIGLTATQRQHFEFIYIKLELLNQKLSAIRKGVQNRPIQKYTYYEDPKSFDIVAYSPRREHYLYSHVDNKINQSSKKIKEFVRENGLLV